MDNSLSSQFEGKSCVVTGGAGFIGSNLSRFLQKAGAEVRVIDNFSTGRKENVSDFEELGIEVLELDITNQEKTHKFYDNIDFVFHQAAIASVPFSIKNPDLSAHHNVGGTVSALQNSSSNKVTKLIFASSTAIYGNTIKIPTSEFTESMPQSPYAEQKLAGENHCYDYFDSGRLRTTSLRYFNVFGPYQDPKSEYSAVIPKFIDLALQNKDLIVYGDGNSTRDFVFVDDVIQANLRAAVSDKSDGEVINVASGQTMAIVNLATLIIELTSSKSSIIFKEPRKGDIIHSAADIKKAKILLGYKPQTNIINDLSKTIDYFRSN